MESQVGNFEAGKEADFVVLDYGATPLLEMRCGYAKSIEEKLFALQMLGDDRTIRQTWIMGECGHTRG